MNRFESVARSLSAFCFDRDETGLIQYTEQIDPVGRNDPNQWAIEAASIQEECFQIVKMGLR